MARLQSNNFPPEFSSDGGTTWKTLICVTDWDLTGDNETTEEQTFCGVITGVGSAGFSGSANAVADTAPSGAQVSNEDALSWFVNATLLKFRVQSPGSGTPGIDFYVNFDTYVTSYAMNFTSAEVVKFSIGWESTGAIDITP